MKVQLEHLSPSTIDEWFGVSLVSATEVLLARNEAVQGLGGQSKGVPHEKRHYDSLLGFLQVHGRIQDNAV